MRFFVVLLSISISILAGCARNPVEIECYENGNVKRITWKRGVSNLHVFCWDCGNNNQSTTQQGRAGHDD